MKCCSITKYQNTMKPFVKDLAGLGQVGVDRACVFSLLLPFHDTQLICCYLLIGLCLTTWEVTAFPSYFWIMAFHHQYASLLILGSVGFLASEHKSMFDSLALLWWFFRKDKMDCNLPLVLVSAGSERPHEQHLLSGPSEYPSQCCFT